MQNDPSALMGVVAPAMKLTALVKLVIVIEAPATA